MLGEDEWLYFKARVQYPDVSTLAFAIDVTSGAADLFVRGGNAQPTLAEHQRSELAIAVGASATISLQPAGDASPCSIAECVVHCGVRGALPGWSSFVLRVSLAVERRGVHIDLPPSIAGSLPYQMASFGAPMPFGQGLSVPLALAEPEELCLPAGQPGAAFAGGHAPSLAGAVALVRRGGCLFVDKVAAAALAGAVGVLVVNNNATVPEQLLIMDVPSSMDAAQQELIGRVPAAMVAFGDGERLLAALRAGNESAVTLAHADERAPVPLPSDSTAVAHSTADRQASVFALRGLRGEATSLGGAQQYRIVASFASAAVGSVPELLLLAGSANASAEAAPSLTRFAAQGERTASGSVLTLRRDLHPSLFQTDAPPPLLAVFANHGGGFALPVTLACTASREIELLPASTFSGTSAAGGDLLAFSLPLDTHLYGRAAIELQLTVDSERDMTAALYAAVGTVAPDASTAAWSAEDNRLKRSRRLVLRASVELAGSERPSRLHFSLRTVETQLSFTLSVSVLYPQPPASSGPAPSPSPAPAPSPGGASPSPAASPSAAGSAAAAGGSDGELPLCEYRVVPMAYTDEPLLANVLSQGVRLPDDRLAFAHDMLVVLLVSACLLMLAERSSRQAAQTAPLRTPRQCWCAPAPPCPRAVPPPPRCLRGGPSWARLATPSLRSPRARAAPQPHPPPPRLCLRRSLSWSQGVCCARARRACSTAAALGHFLPAAAHLASQGRARRGHRARRLLRRVGPRLSRRARRARPGQLRVPTAAQPQPHARPIYRPRGRRRHRRGMAAPSFRRHGGWRARLHAARCTRHRIGRRLLRVCLARAIRAARAERRCGGRRRSRLGSGWAGRAAGHPRTRTAVALRLRALRLCLRAPPLGRRAGHRIRARNCRGDGGARRRLVATRRALGSARAAAGARMPASQWRSRSASAAAKRDGGSGGRQPCAALACGSRHRSQEGPRCWRLARSINGATARSGRSIASWRRQRISRGV